jgi:ATP-dependent Lon protease
MANYNEYSEHMTLPLLPLTGTVFAFPKITTTINVSDANTINAIEHSEKINSLLFAITQRDPYADTFSLKNVAEVGVVVKLKQVTKRNGVLTVTVEGVCRANTINAFAVSGFYMADIETKIIDSDISEEESIALLNVIKDYAKTSVSLFNSNIL